MTMIRKLDTLVGKNEYYMKIRDINVSDFHIVLIFSNKRVTNRRH